MIIKDYNKDDNNDYNNDYNGDYVEHVYWQPLFGRNPSQELSEENWIAC